MLQLLLADNPFNITPFLVSIIISSISMIFLLSPLYTYYGKNYSCYCDCYSYSYFSCYCKTC